MTLISGLTVVWDRLVFEKRERHKEWGRESAEAMHNSSNRKNPQCRTSVEEARKRRTGDSPPLRQRRTALAGKEVICRKKLLIQRRDGAQAKEPVSAVGNE